jgi:hypothetical protein
MPKTIEQRIREEIARKIVVKITHRKRAKAFIVTTPFFNEQVMDTPTRQVSKASALAALLIAARISPRLVWKIEPVK